MNLEPKTSVRELALGIPGATRVFEKIGIDYCCGGQQSLQDACAKAGITIEAVRSSLESEERSHLTPEPNVLAVTLAELIDHIVETHHVFTRNEIGRLRTLLNKVCSKHIKNHPELTRLLSLFEVLASELVTHMMKEERVLFPYVMALEDSVRNGRSIQSPQFGTVANPVRMMMIEHDKAGELLKTMRQTTSNYALPDDACVSYQTLFQALDALEKDLHQHIHLENNILFPRAVEMEPPLS